LEEGSCLKQDWDIRGDAELADRNNSKMLIKVILKGIEAKITNNEYKE
jgi:hypothetical protein